MGIHTVDDRPKYVYELLYGSQAPADGHAVHALSQLLTIVSCIRHSVVLLLSSRRTDALKMCSGINRSSKRKVLSQFNYLAQWRHYELSSRLASFQQQSGRRYRKKMQVC